MTTGKRPGAAAAPRTAHSGVDKVGAMAEIQSLAWAVGFGSPKLVSVAISFA